MKQIKTTQCEVVISEDESYPVFSLSLNRTPNASGVLAYVPKKFTKRYYKVEKEHDKMQSELQTLYANGIPKRAKRKRR